MNSEPNDEPSGALTRLRRLNLLWIRFIAWGWLAAVLFGTVDSLKASSECSRASWWTCLLLVGTAAVPFLYLKWIQGWYRRHPPVARFSRSWFRRAATRGLVGTAFVLIALAAAEISSRRIGSSHAGELAEEFVQTDSVVLQKVAKRGVTEGGGTFTYTRGAWHAGYEFWLRGSEPEDLIIVHLDRAGTQWKVAGWEFDSHYHASFFTVANNRTVSATSEPNPPRRGGRSASGRQHRRAGCG